MFLHADSEESDQTGQMPRLIRVFAGRTSFCWFCHEVAQFCRFCCAQANLDSVPESQNVKKHKLSECFHIKN